MRVRGVGGPRIASAARRWVTITSALPLVAWMLVAPPAGPDALAAPSPVDDCTAAETYDNGSAENGYSAGPGVTFEAVQRFTPSVYPATYGIVCIALTHLSVERDITFQIVVRDDDGGGGTPGTLLGSRSVTAREVPGGGSPGCLFYRFDISRLGVLVPDGSAFIGVRWTGQNPNHFLCADETASTPLHPGFVNFNDGGWGAIQDTFTSYRALLVRAKSKGPLTCLGRPVTILGTPGADLIAGTGGNDVVLAGGGPDVIRTKGGADRICAGGGNDTVRSGGARDRIDGGSGSDKLFGGAGPDVILARSGDDLARGGGGKDVLRLGGNDDRGFGGPGDDTLLGQAGDDTLDGGPGTDTCKPGGGNDTVQACEQ